MDSLAGLRFGRAYLASCRTTLARRPLPALHLVVGNEACDCDSAVSALAHAYRLSTAPAAGVAAPAAPAFVPVVSCERADWPLRREAATLLERCLALEDAAADTVGPSGSAGAPGSVAAQGAQAAQAAQAARGDDAREQLASLLVFVDDVEAALADASAPPSVSVTLVDHNEFKGALPAALRRAGVEPDAAVREIIDHHADAGSHQHVRGAERRVAFDAATNAATAGSACTLVASLLLGDLDIAELSSGGRGPAPARAGIDARLAEVLGSTILLDTVGMDPAAGKGTPLDAAVLERLRAVIERECGRAEAGARLDARAVSGRLMALKSEPAFWSGLSVAQALGFDFKSFEAARPSSSAAVFGTSSVMAGLGNFFGGWSGDAAPAGVPLRVAPARARDAAAFCAARGLDFEVVLTAEVLPTGGMRRGLAFVAPAGSAGAALADAAALRLQSAMPELEMRELDVSGAEDVFLRAFEQGNAKASRKQVVPLLMRVLVE